MKNNELVWSMLQYKLNFNLFVVEKCLNPFLLQMVYSCSISSLCFENVGSVLALLFQHYFLLKKGNKWNFKMSFITLISNVFRKINSKHVLLTKNWWNWPGQHTLPRTSHKYKMKGTSHKILSEMWSHTQEWKLLYYQNSSLQSYFWLAL